MPHPAPLSVDTSIGCVFVDRKTIFVLCAEGPTGPRASRRREFPNAGGFVIATCQDVAIGQELSLPNRAGMSDKCAIISPVVVSHRQPIYLDFR